MMYEDYEFLKTNRSGRILTITITRPDALNAVNAALHKELSRIFSDVDRDDETDPLEPRKALARQHRADEHGGLNGAKQQKRSSRRGDVVVREREERRVSKKCQGRNDARPTFKGWLVSHLLGQ